MNEKRINDGGPAFPTSETCWGSMSLRDYFAAKAMQGLLSSDPEWQADAVDIAGLAYVQADRMLEARAAQEPLA